MFQFLIGTVKTLYYRINIENREAFQFLIGTVKTADTPPVGALIVVFQFLIGTVKTRREASFFYVFMLVSIPHRYCKNLI